MLENTKLYHLLITQALSPDQIIYKKNQILKFTGMERSHRINGELKLVLKATTGPAGNGGHGPLGPRRREGDTAPGAREEGRMYQREGASTPGTRGGWRQYQRQGALGPMTRRGGWPDRRQGGPGPVIRGRDGPDRRQEAAGTDQRQEEAGPGTRGGGGPDRKQEATDLGPGTSGMCGPDQTKGAAGPLNRGHQSWTVQGGQLPSYQNRSIQQTPNVHQPVGLGPVHQYQAPQYYVGQPFSGPYYNYTSVPGPYSGPTTVSGPA